jgi:hypothetical protein
MATELPPDLIWGPADPIMRFEIAAAQAAAGPRGTAREVSC